MRLVVTGGRYFNDIALVDWALSAVHRKHSISLLIEGEARGADRLCKAWAQRAGIAIKPFPAQWDCYKKRAGPIRNQQMIDEGRPEAAVAFPGGDGTADMVNRLKRAGIPVWDLRS